MQKLKHFKKFWNYIKDDKLKLLFYIILVGLSYLPALISVYFWGIAVEALVAKNLANFTLYLAIYEGIYIIFYTFLQIPRDYLYTYFEIKFTKNVSIDLYKKIDNLPAIAFEEVGVGEFINRLYTDPDRVMELLAKIVRLICKAIVVIVVMIIALQISFILFLEIIFLAIIMGFISTKFFPKIKKSQENIKKESDAYVKVATENITGIREIKSLGITSIIEENISKVIHKLFNHTAKVRKYERWYYALNNLAYFLIQFLILFTTGKAFLEGTISLSIFLMMETYIWRIDEVVESISDFGVSFNKVTVSLKRINEILNNKLYQDEKYGNQVLNNAKGIIEFKNVRFKYKENENYTLNNLNLKITPHKKIAIVGKSGNGKSTIFNLLLRYFDPTKGEITLDEINLKDLTKESLRNNISIIRQSPFIFNLSILDNFKLVKPDVTLENVRSFCKKAYIDDYIMSLPEQYNTIIGEGGINLSGGQKQRLAIARTLLLNTKIILFDEATSALDNESQEFIKKTIDNLVKDHTIIIVGHRLSTIMDADEIHVIEQGKLIASGPHQELLKTCKSYQTLYQSESN
ncbi:aBC-type multidrug transport system ATPase and permease component [Mycoplasma sp. CAG:776]|nr:aBC-type multidrug transport system ATPase and permease component [Mycoplasma sp. CAG:776]